MIKQYNIIINLLYYNMNNNDNDISCDENKNNETFCKYQELLNESKCSSFKQNSSVEKEFAK